MGYIRLKEMSLWTLYLQHVLARSFVWVVTKGNWRTIVGWFVVYVMAKDFVVGIGRRVRGLLSGN